MISVCMATYNGELYIKEQIESILRNISKSDELIISDDGSTDATISIIKDYIKRDNRIFLFDGPRNGVVKNFENAIIHSNGDIIFLSDQDDIWTDNKVLSVMKCFENKQCLVVLHDATIIDGNGQEIENSFFKHRGSKKGFLKNIIKNSYLGCCMAFRKELIPVVLPMPNKIEMHDWWIGMISELKHGTIINYEKLLLYRRHGNNVSSMHHHPLKKMLFNRFYLLKELFKRVRKFKNG